MVVSETLEAFARRLAREIVHPNPEIRIMPSRIIRANEATIARFGQTIAVTSIMEVIAKAVRERAEELECQPPVGVHALRRAFYRKLSKPKPNTGGSFAPPSLGRVPEAVAPTTSAPTRNASDILAADRARKERTRAIDE